MVRSTSGSTVLRLAHETRDRPACSSASRDRACMRSSLRATTRLPSLPERPTARPPAALMPLTICLLIEPVSTISTTSMAAASVTRNPSTKDEGIASFFSIAPICGPPPWTTTGSMPVCFISTMSCAKFSDDAAFHGVAAIFHDDGLAVVAKNVGQRFDENARGRAPARHARACCGPGRRRPAAPCGRPPQIRRLIAQSYRGQRGDVCLAAHRGP